MLIINADDWGRDDKATDTSLACHRLQRITSVSGMVFMKDSARAASIADAEGVDVGLHINFTEAFTASNCPPGLAADQERIRRFLKRNKYALLLYHPLLTTAFRNVFDAQLEEFQRIYRGQPTHFDGHQHMHLATNMLLQRLIPEGAKVRRSFSFRSGEKSFLNRAYRQIVDRHLARHYQMTGYFFGLETALAAGNPQDIFDLARTADVELMTHAWNQAEYDWLMGDAFLRCSGGVTLRGYAGL